MNVANALNVYTDDSESFGYVASHSLPGYQIVDEIIESSIPNGLESNLGGYSDALKTWKTIKFPSAVRFISGDQIKYVADNPLSGLVSGEYYYVKVIKSNEVQLYASKSALKTAAQELENNSIVRFIHSEVQNLTDAVKEKADAMIYCNSIHYVPDKNKLLTEIRNKLNSNGILAFNTSFYDGSHPDDSLEFYRKWMFRSYAIIHNRFV